MTPGRAAASDLQVHRDWHSKPDAAVKFNLGESWFVKLKQWKTEVEMILRVTGSGTARGFHWQPVS